jgi:hypothetical protein
MVPPRLCRCRRDPEQDNTWPLGSNAFIASNELSGLGCGFSNGLTSRHAIADRRSVSRRTSRQIGTWQKEATPDWTHSGDEFVRSVHRVHAVPAFPGHEHAYGRRAHIDYADQERPSVRVCKNCGISLVFFRKNWRDEGQHPHRDPRSDRRRSHKKELERWYTLVKPELLPHPSTQHMAVWNKYCPDARSPRW